MRWPDLKNWCAWQLASEMSHSTSGRSSQQPVVSALGRVGEKNHLSSFSACVGFARNYYYFSVPQKWKTVFLRPYRWSSLPHTELQHENGASPLLKWHVKAASGRSQPATPGVLSWTQETFLMGFFSKSAPPPAWLLFQLILDFKMLYLYIDFEPCVHYHRIPTLLVRTERHRDFAFFGCLLVGRHDWKSSSKPLTILKNLLRSFYFIVPEWKAQRSLKPWISKSFSNDLLILTINLVLLLFHILKISEKNNSTLCFRYNYIVLKILFFCFKISLLWLQFLIRETHLL